MAKTKAGGAATATPPATPKKQTGGVTKPKKGKATPTPKKGKSKGKDDDDDPLAAQPIGLFYLDYHHVHPTVDDEDDSDIGKEKKNRRIATKTILKGIF
ncbi:hypothetical protein H9Q70_011237 [Fusarium xylarioides]|nr:hypothetical protein H9Q70_011237 [Fusarium xylarioides]KAG5775572.1 hypothetical protein H9Q73_010753 [Fusarium xylarioides]